MPRRMPLRRRGRRSTPPDHLPPRLRQAHRLLARGKHRQAAELYMNLAHRAEDLHIPRAPLLFIQAGRAFVLGNDLDRGKDQFIHAFALLAAQGQWARLNRLASRIEADLAHLGYEELADNLSEYLQELVPDATEAPSVMRQPLVLPSKCEACGADLHPEEVEFLADESAACGYCGSRVMLEQR